tara:strand:+ start:525 stop:665 length:141 start_codon:yes stop_codon:yes gene_type:complete
MTLESRVVKLEAAVSQMQHNFRRLEILLYVAITEGLIVITSTAGVV